MTTLPQCVGDWTRFTESPVLNLACAVVFQTIADKDEVEELTPFFSACGYQWLVGSLQYAYEGQQANGTHGRTGSNT